LGHTHHQVLKLRVDPGTSTCFPLCGAIELLRDELAMPAQNGVRLGNFGDFF
jgi:hypothetical protein